MNPLFARTIDARGRRVGLLSGGLHNLEHASRRALPDIVRDELQMRRVRRISVAIFVLAAIGTLLRELLDPPTTGVKFPFRFPAPIAMGFVIPVAFYAFLNSNLRGLPKRRAKIRDALISAGYCATCGYTISTTPADVNAVFTCPECGSAWTRPTA